MANKLALEAGIGCRLLLKHPVIVWLIRLVASRAGRDGCSPSRRIFGKPYDGSICKFGEQVHYVFRVVSNRVESWGKMELTDDHLLAVPLPSPSSREVRMEITGSSGSRRPLEEGTESSSKRVRGLAGMLLFDENVTSDWQHSILEAHTSDLSNDQRGPENNIDHMQQPDTDIPGVWRCQAELKSDLYGDRTAMPS